MNLNQKLIKQCTIVTILSAVVLMVINVYLSAAVAQDGLMIDSLSKRSDSLKHEIAALEQTLMSKNSLIDLSSKANAEGYQKPESVVAITTSTPVTANAR